ncbi:hypothetical protein JCM19037_3677 [Geomicrobium sp. JCM 19037]|uniref:hypothetical protein n=1 Tax=Geomicrobium sp. JCM 19037 TaxID=1460634 RepID=UPI00045F3F54|nr:hypothetical protein [Geomicrobium sp. JCM 19037]GAK05199.1 hypothetical protein JCM19037_3677 [Geomicrobium sp. JCM 19037]
MIENTMLLPHKYLDPVEPMVIGECEGCKDNVHETDEHLEIDDVLLHDDTTCIAAYIREVAVRR